MNIPFTKFLYFLFIIPFILHQDFYVTSKIAHNFLSIRQYKNDEIFFKKLLFSLVFFTNYDQMNFTKYPLLKIHDLNKLIDTKYKFLI